MVGVLIAMRRAVTRAGARGKRLWGVLVLLVLVTALAVGTLLAGFGHYARAASGADVAAVLTLGWLLGRVAGPLLTGDDATLRLDWFKLLPVPPKRLARALLGAAFANVSLVFSAIAFGCLIAWGARFGVGPALTAVAAVLLELVLAVVASVVAVGLFGPVVSSRRGRDAGALLVAVAVTLVSLASSLVPAAAKVLTSGRDPVLSAVVRALPSGWGAVAVDGARRGQPLPVVLGLGGLVALTGVLVAAWPALLRRRLLMSPGGGRTHRARARRPFRAWLPATPLGAVVDRELRLYARSVLRSVSYLIALLVGVLACVVPALSGAGVVLPFGGALFTVIAAATATNMYGDEGTALWLLLVVPGARRPDVRGRQLAWLLVTAPPGLLLTVVLTAISGQGWAWPWTLGLEAALLGGGAGLVVAASALAVVPLTAQGTPTPQRQLKVNLMLVLTVLSTAPSVLLLALGAAGHHAALSWSALPAGCVTGALLTWGLGRVAYRRLERRGPEVFAAVRRGA